MFGTPRILREGFGLRERGVMTGKEEMFVREGFEWSTLQWVNPKFKVGLGHKCIRSLPFQKGMGMKILFL